MPLSKFWAILKGLLIKIFVMLLFGSILGCLAIKLDWGFGYAAAIVMVLCSGFGANIINFAARKVLSSRLENAGRGIKLVVQMTSRLFTHTIGWLIVIEISGRILGFSLFRWEVLIWLFIFIIINFIINAVKQLKSFYKELIEKDLAEEKLKALAAQAELKALKAQINPHFLFNSLNTIASLISSNPVKAEEAVEKLAEIFRYTLSCSEHEYISLQKELDFLDSYLDIEKARFGNRLTVIKSIEPETLEQMIPSLIIQPLLENSLKHGADRGGSFFIEIRCFSDSDIIVIEIRDQGPGVPEDIKLGNYTKGVGLKNVNERLIRLYGEDYSLKIRNNIPCGTVSVIKIPMRLKDA
ncbi:MAG: histidine kinase [Spirochaetales bacterium]|nr:histidine kinase [Spirochaetales bacterium]